MASRSTHPVGWTSAGCGKRDAGSALSQWWSGKFTLDEYHERLKSIRDCRIARVEDAGHMMHHDRPSEVAQLIGKFIAEG